MCRAVFIRRVYRLVGRSCATIVSTARSEPTSCDRSFLEKLGTSLAASSVETWCVFDDAASGAACRNALRLVGVGLPCSELPKER